MNATFSIPVRPEKAVEKACCAPKHEQHHFSKASHFAWILLPVAVGMGYRIGVTTVESPVLRLGMYLLFLGCLGAAIFLLYGVGQVVDHEEGE